MRPFRHSLPNSSLESFIQVTDKGWVALYLGKQQKKIKISPDGLKVFIESERKGKLEYRPFTPKPDSNAMPEYQTDHL